MTMKKIMNLFVLAIALAVVFVGCKKDDPVKDAPKPTLTSGAKSGGVVVTGEAITYVIDVKSTVDLKTLTITAPAGTTITLTEKDNKITGTASPYSFAEKCKEATITAKVTINKVGLDSVKFSFANVNVGFDKAVSDAFNAISSIVEYKNVSLNFVSTDLGAKNCFVAKDGTQVGANGTGFDFVYATNGATGIKNSIVSPDATWLGGSTGVYGSNGLNYSTTGKNKTLLAKGTGYSTADAKVLSLQTVTSSTVLGGGNGVNDVKTGDVIVFKTADGKNGIISVVSAPSNVKNGLKVSYSITLDVKVQTVGSAGK